MSRLFLPPARFPRRIFSRLLSDRAQDSLSSISKPILLTQRSVLRLTGEDVCGFLQGLVTNDMTYLQATPALYALMLNQRGRVLYDLIIFNAEPGKEPSTVFLDCDASLRANLIKQLTVYRLRKKIKFEKDDNLAVFADPHSTKEFTAEKFDKTKRLVVDDPRTSLLGRRMIATRGTPNDEAGELAMQHYRLVHGIPEGPGDLPPGECFPLESNGDYLNGISFHKGCYVGQELTARTHHTGVVRKRLMPISLETELEVGTKLRDASSGKLVGKVRSIFDGVGLGLMRIEDALAAERIEAEVDGKKSEVRVYKPEWWSDLRVKGYQPE